MADDFETFSRGDLLYKGASLGEVVSGRLHIANGAGVVKTLRRGPAGFHKGSVEGSVSFNEAVLKAGMNEDFVDAILKQRPVTIEAIVADDIRIRVTGIMQGADFSFGENSFVTGDFSVSGKIKRV